MKPRLGRCKALFIVVAFLAVATQSVAQGPNLPPLKSVPVPKPANLSKYVADESTLVALGKAFFWDAQVSSDGRVACATCHFHAGADHRAQNQLAGGSSFPADYALAMSDFPFHRLSDINSNQSPVLRDTPQVAGSAGLPRRMFTDVVLGSSVETGYDASDQPAFSVDGLNVRQATGRNTPTVINSVFNARNFWDGRASGVFTGMTPFGDSDTRQNALVNVSGRLAAEAVRMENSSLASQAVGPTLSSVEMSYDGRTWPKVGKKLLALAPLAGQRVALSDGVLGPYANPEGAGLLPSVTYASLIRAAFQPLYWNSPQLVDAGGAPLTARTQTDTSEFSQAEFNFPLFWGLAIQAYEATLVSDDSRFDRFAAGDPSALTGAEQRGFAVFRGRGGCAGCHTGTEFTAASVSQLNRSGPVRRNRGGVAGDTGFFRVGVRPSGEDTGLGGSDGFGKPLAVGIAQNAVLNVDGSFKVPTLRNIEFTGPYFHNGGQATLEQLADFYSRGGDFPAGSAIRPRNLSPQDRSDLVAFLKSLSDDRVRFERAPFDHPELCIPVGHPRSSAASLVPNADSGYPLSAMDQYALIPAVGRSGNPAPLQTFDELLQGIGTDGSRAHTLAESCVRQ